MRVAVTCHVMRRHCNSLSSHARGLIVARLDVEAPPTRAYEQLVGADQILSGVHWNPHNAVELASSVGCARRRVCGMMTTMMMMMRDVGIVSYSLRRTCASGTWNGHSAYCTATTIGIRSLPYNGRLHAHACWHREMQEVPCVSGMRVVPAVVCPVTPACCDRRMV